MGIHPVYLNEIEKGKKNITLFNAHKLTSVLNISLLNLIANKGQKRYKAIIFDLHYTIIRLFPSRGAVYQKILKNHNFNANPRIIKKTFSKIWRRYGDKNISINSLKQINEKLIEKWWLEFHRRMLDELGLKNKKISYAINKEISDQFYCNPKIHRMYNDAKKILPFLKRKGVKLVLITNGYGSTKNIISHFSLEKYFDFIGISSDLKISKPDPKIYKKVLKIIKVQPNEVLCVGDSYPTDILGAKKAGCDAALIDRRNEQYKKNYNCIYLNNLTQIKNLV